MKIGSVETKNNIFLAPMAGITNLAFRTLCRQNSCGLAYSEMISINGIYYGSENTLKLLETNASDRPLAIQLFGHDPKIFTEAIKKIDSDKFDIININMGCPAKKIIRNGDGSFLMNNPKLIYEIVNACTRATNKPISVKIRKGFDKPNALEIAKIIEQAGAAAICIHGRTAKQEYSGVADWEIIAQLKENISIPVIGNGDIKSCEDAKKMLDQTKCDAIMIGRASLGNPWIFKQIEQYLQTGINNFSVSNKEKMDTAKKHLRLLNATGNVLEMRKHLSWYIKKFHNASSIRCEINLCNTYDDFESLLNKIIDGLL